MCIVQLYLTALQHTERCNKDIVCTVRVRCKMDENIYNKYKLYHVIYTYYTFMMNNNDLFPADTDNR